MSVLGALRSTWRWWAPPVALFVLLGGAVVVWLVAVDDSPIHYAVP